MAYNTKFSRDEIKTIGGRLHAVRILTKLSREEFSAKVQIPCTSIKNWEIGRALPRREGLISVSTAFRSLGVFASLEWLLYGSGIGPSYLGTETFERKDKSGEYINQQIELFKKNQRSNGYNPVIAHVATQDMAPAYLVGDVIGGIILSDEVIRREMTSERFRNRPWLVMGPHGLFEPAWLYLSANKWLINTTKDIELKEYHAPSIAMVKWHYCSAEHT